MRSPSKAGSDSRNAKQDAEACVLLAFIRVRDTHLQVPGNLALPSKDRAGRRVAVLFGERSFLQLMNLSLLTERCEAANRS